MPPDAQALAAIHAAFAEPADWQQDSLAPVACTVVPFHAPGELAFGRGTSAGRKGFEVPKTALPFRPINGDIVTVDTVVWRVIEVIDYREASAWRVFVEEAA